MPWVHKSCKSLNKKELYETCFTKGSCTNYQKQDHVTFISLILFFFLTKYSILTFLDCLEAIDIGLRKVKLKRLWINSKVQGRGVLHKKELWEEGGMLKSWDFLIIIIINYYYYYYYFIFYYLGRKKVTFWICAQKWLCSAVSEWLPKTALGSKWIHF